MPHKTPKVSVLMPAYNSEKYIGESIESILNQTFRDFELIIVNDGSIDGTADVVKKYAKKDKRIKFINNKKNKGVAAVRNELLDNASGEYLAFQDSDDISVPERLDIQVRFLENNPDVSAVSANLCNLKGERVSNISGHIGIMDFYISNPMPNAVSMFRKSEVEKYGLRYNPEYKTAEDYDFWQRAARVMNIYILPDVLYKYRVLDNSLSHNNPDLSKFDKIIQDELIKHLTGNPFLRTKIAPRYRVMLFGFIPLLKVKRNRIYLFEVIPLLKMRNMWWRLFDILPVCKLKA